MGAQVWPKLTAETSLDPPLRDCLRLFLSAAMAMTAQGMMPDSNLYDKILYVSKKHFDSVSKLVKSGKEISTDMIDNLMVPTDLPNDSVLVPIDVSVEAFGEVYDGHEDLMEEIGAKGVAEAVIAGMELFEKTKLDFKESERPIAMTVGDWKQVPGDTDDEDEEDEDDEEVEDAGEEGEEEEGEEEDAEEDEEDEPAAAKKAKTA